MSHRSTQITNVTTYCQEVPNITFLLKCIHKNWLKVKRHKAGNRYWSLAGMNKNLFLHLTKPFRRSQVCNSFVIGPPMGGPNAI